MNKIDFIFLNINENEINNFDNYEFIELKNVEFISKN